MKPIWKKRLNALFVIGSSLLVATTPQSTYADASCTQFLAEKVKQANPGQWPGMYYTIDMSMHREDVKWVSYSDGFLTPNANGSFSGQANQLFSDRIAGQQPFNINASDYLDLNLSPTGLLRIHSVTWNFDTSWDLSCKGSVLTAYFPHFGVITLTFRDLFIVVQ